MQLFSKKCAPISRSYVTDSSLYISLDFDEEVDTQILGRDVQVKI